MRWALKLRPDWHYGVQFLPFLRTDLNRGTILPFTVRGGALRIAGAGHAGRWA